MALSPDILRIIMGSTGSGGAPTSMPSRPNPNAGLGTFLPTGYQPASFGGPSMPSRPGPMQGSFSPMGGFTPGGGMGPAMGSRPAPSMGMGGMFGGGAQQISPDQLSAILGRGGRNPDGSPHTGDEAFFGPQVGGGGMPRYNQSGTADIFMGMDPSQMGIGHSFGASAPVNAPIPTLPGWGAQPAPVASQGTTLAALLGRSGRAI